MDYWWRKNRIGAQGSESAYKGFEIVMGILRSIVARGQVALPLGPGEDEMEALARVLPDRPVLRRRKATARSTQPPFAPRKPLRPP